MAIYHQFQSVRLTAGADLSSCEGCFVTVDGATGTANLTAATTTPDKVYGVLDGVDVKDRPVDVILPGCSGIVGAKLHSGSAAVVPGDRLVLAANGTVTKGTSGTLVAVAVGSGTAGNLTPARLVQPSTLAAQVES